MKHKLVLFLVQFWHDIEVDWDAFSVFGLHMSGLKILDWDWIHQFGRSSDRMVAKMWWDCRWIDRLWATVTSNGILRFCWGLQDHWKHSKGCQKAVKIRFYWSRSAEVWCSSKGLSARKWLHTRHPWSVIKYGVHFETGKSGVQQHN